MSWNRVEEFVLHVGVEVLLIPALPRERSGPRRFFLPLLNVLYLARAGGVLHGRFVAEADHD